MSWGVLPAGAWGVFLAGLIAMLTGVVAFALLNTLARRHGWVEGHALGWGFLLALLTNGSVDFFHLLRLFLLDARFPARVEQALRGIHDPEHLGARFLAEIAGALAGVLAGWLWGEWRRGTRR